MPDLLADHAAHRACREVVDLCSHLIRFNASNPGGWERPAAEYVAGQLAGAGGRKARSPNRNLAMLAWLPESRGAAHACRPCSSTITLTSSRRSRKSGKLTRSAARYETAASGDAERLT